MAEPDPEESPGLASGDEGLSGALGSLNLSDRPSSSAHPAGQTRPISDLAVVEAAPQIPLDHQAGHQLSIRGDPSLAALDRVLLERHPQGRNRRELRFYVVWSVPRYDGPLDLTGLHAGLDGEAYTALLRANEWHFRGLAFRRVSSLAEGRTVFLAEANRHRLGAERAGVIYWWE